MPESSTLPKSMRAQVLVKPGAPLVPRELPVPVPGPDQVLVRILACAVCRTDLHIVDGELPHPNLPLIPGHEIVGRIVQLGSRVTGLRVGDRIGIPWLGGTCGTCSYCRSNRENLCANAQFTGYTMAGGYAEYCIADHRYCFPLPAAYSDIEAAPLLCAGLIGYRAYMMAGTGSRLGLYGFGAAAHIICQVAVHQGRQVYAFTRAGDGVAQDLALSLGATWAGDSNTLPPESLDSAILFAPAGFLVPLALKAVHPGGTVVCAGIHMSDIPSFPYELLWGERTLRSVANLTRRDGLDFFKAIESLQITTKTHLFPLEQANQALTMLRDGRINGAAVLAIAETR